ncbi:rRNA N6-adenosine-methyltransferase ZCCHC4 isoform X4 [Cyrtonyx montezumae]|uniref:rRNA N6-adenosine-methyltransferase ZCCHC4 isoform X4 n=1 Tax=Cyrtonyx montezumae TaxID=9017 RepID=UPI0032DB593A
MAAGPGGLALLHASAGAPCCPHGPALLFVRTSQGKEEGRRFYACSACRDRKDCNFFQWEDEKVSQTRLAAREEYNRSHQAPCTHRQNVERYKNFVLLPLSKRRFCQECQQLLLPTEWEEHSGHQFLYDISIAQLKSPSQLLYPLENKKTNAQYLFADRSCQFLLDLIISLGFRRVLSVGTPRLHELIQSKASQEENFRVRSLLLDIDFRYSQFYTEDEFCHYNMFNHYFFGGEAAHETCRKFLHQDKDERVIMVTDPPFGGLVEALASSFKKLMAMWKDTEKGGNKNQEMPMFWIFPYFFESRILEFFPSFSMMDYQTMIIMHYINMVKQVVDSPLSVSSPTCPQMSLYFLQKRAIGFVLSVSGMLVLAITTVKYAIPVHQKMVGDGNIVLFAKNV